MNTLLLIDGDPLIFRSFYNNSQDPGLRSDGLPTGAVDGFLTRFGDLLRDDLKDHRFSHAAVVFDAPGKGWRHKAMPAYKSGRPPRPVDLQAQLLMAKAMVPLFGMKAVQQKGYEADDLIATYAELNHHAGGETVIVSSDKDLQCLVRPGVVIYSPIADREERWITEVEVEAKWGVRPHLVPEVQALCGDKVDDVPGLPGVGGKGAALLIREHGCVESVIAAAERHELRLPRHKLINYEVDRLKDDIRIWRRVVGLHDQVPVITPLKDLEVYPADGREIIACLKALEISSLTKWIAWKHDLRADEIPPSPDMLAMAEEMMEWRAP